MPRSTKESEDEMETRSGRRTRASALSVTDSPLRRSTRRKQTSNYDDNSSPESMASDVTAQTRTTRRRTGTLDSVTSETTRSLRSRKTSTTSEASEIHESENEGRRRSTRKSSLVPSGIDTPTNTRLKRGARAGSESKTMSPVVRITRRTRASSVDPEVTDDRPSSNTGTPAKERKGRAFTFPSEPSVIEEAEKPSKDNDNITKIIENEDEDVFVVVVDENTNNAGNFSTSHELSSSPVKSEKSVSNDDEFQSQKDGDIETREALENSLEALISQTAPEEDTEVPTENEKQKLVDNANDNALKDLPKVLVEKAQLITNPIEVTETSPGNKENDITYGQDRKKRSNTARRSSGSLPKKSINIVLGKTEVNRHVSQLSDDKLALTPTNQDNVTAAMASIESQNDEIIFIDDTDTDEPEKSHESSKNRRKSLRLKKTLNPDEKTEIDEELNKSSEKSGIEEKNNSNEKTNEETEKPQNSFKDIPAEEWKEKKEKTVDNDDKVDSDGDCDLILVGKGGWSADEADDDDKNKDNYDSDDTVIVAKKIDMPDKLEMSTINDELMEVGEDQLDTEIDDGPDELSRETKKIQRKSLTRKSESKSDEKLKRKSVAERLDNSVVPMEVDDDDDKDSDSFMIKSRKPVGDDDSSDDEASEVDVGKSSEILDSSGKPRRRTSSGEARRSLVRSRSSSRLLDICDTDTSSDEEEEAERRKKNAAELEDHLNKSRESRFNRMRKSLTQPSSSESKKSDKSESEVEVKKKEATEFEDHLNKSRESGANKMRKLLTQPSSDSKKSDESEDEVEVRKKRASEFEDHLKESRESGANKMRKLLTQPSSDSKKSDESEDEVEVRKKRASEFEDHLKESRESGANKMRKLLTQPSSDSKKSDESEDEVEVRKKRASEFEDHLKESRESGANKMRKLLTQSSANSEKSGDEVEVEKKNTPEAEDEGKNTSEIEEGLEKSRKSMANESRKSLTQRPTASDALESNNLSEDEDEPDEVQTETLEVEDSNKSRKSLASASRKSLTQGQSFSNKNESSSSEDGIEVEDKLNKSRKCSANESRKSLTQQPAASDKLKSDNSSGDENAADEVNDEVSKIEDSNESRKSFASESPRKSFTQRQSFSKKNEEPTSEDEVEVEDLNKSGKISASELRQSVTQLETSSDKKNMEPVEDKNNDEEQKETFEAEVNIKKSRKKSLTQRLSSSKQKEDTTNEDEDEIEGEEDEKKTDQNDSSEEKTSSSSEVKKSSNQRQSSSKDEKGDTSDGKEEKKTSEVTESLALEETNDNEDPEASHVEKTSKIADKLRKSLSKEKSPIKLEINHEVSEEDETSEEVDDPKSSSEAGKEDSSPKKSLKTSENQEKNETSSSDDEENVVKTLNESRKSARASQDNDKVPDDDSGSAKESTVGARGSLHIDAVEAPSESDDDVKKSLPSFLYDADTTESSNSDIEREYNLNGDEQSFSDDNVPYDECRESETEEDDDDDDGEDLNDFIDDEEEGGDEEEDRSEEVVEAVKMKPKQKEQKISDEPQRRSEKISTPKVEEKKPKGSPKKSKKLNSSVEVLKENVSKINKKPVKPSKLNKFNEVYTRRQTILIEDDPDLVDTRILMKEKLNESLPSLKIAESKKIAEETATTGEKKKKRKKKKNAKKADDADQDVGKKTSLKRKEPADEVLKKKEKLIFNLVESDSDEESVEALDALKASKAMKKMKKLVDKTKSKEHHVSPIIKKPIKRLPEEILENISDVPLRPKKRRKINSVFLPSRSMFDNDNEKPENMKIDNEFIPISSCGSTTQFEVVNLKKKKDKKSAAAQVFRERAMNRVQREPMSAYFARQLKLKASGKNKF